MTSIQTNEASEDLIQRFIAACDAGFLDLVSVLGGKTGLMAAASRNHTSVMRFLLEQGADPNRRNANGTTPLMFAKTAAFAYGDCTGMQVLIDAGADRNARDKAGLTALEYTVQRAGMVRDFLEVYKR